MRGASANLPVALFIDSFRCFQKGADWAHIEAMKGSLAAGGRRFESPKCAS